MFNNINFLLLSLLILLSLISNIDSDILLTADGDGLLGESNIFEFIQITILSACIYFHLQSRKDFLRVSNIINFRLRLLMLIFIFYEEISYLTSGGNRFINSINQQSEINIHNLHILFKPIIKIVLGSENVFSINSYTLLVIIFLFIFGFGSYAFRSKANHFLFLEKKYSFYSFIYILNLIISSFLRRFNEHSITFLHSEAVEMFIYILILIDIITKKRTYKIRNW